MDILRSFEDQRLRIVQNEQNMGVTASLNRGISMIDTEYIARMDADDISLPERLKVQIAFMDAHPMIGMSGTSFERFIHTNTGIRELSRIDLPSTHEKLRFLLLFRCPFGHFSVIMRRSVLEEKGLLYSEDFPHAEDYELWTRLCFHTKIANLPEALVRRRLHPMSMSRLNAELQQRSATQIRVAYARACGLPIPDNEYDFFGRLFGPSFTTDFGGLWKAARFLDVVESFGLGELDLPRNYVHDWLQRYWYAFCSLHISLGLGVLRVYCSRRWSWSSNRLSILKLLVRCLFGMRGKTL
jgi:glycosyltransferase involved in cell wall biosynthesis